MAEEIKFCKYGCGREAKYPLKSSNGELVICEKFPGRCPIIRKKNSDKVKIAHEEGRILNWLQVNKGRAWNKGLTKETDSRIKKSSERLKNKIASGEIIPAWLGKNHSEETKAKISNTVSEKIKNNEWHIESCGRCKKIKYEHKGEIITIDGSWELKFIEFLNTKNIEWERNKIGFKYTFEDKTKIYFPDFYLKDFDLYVEVKGYKTNKDEAKWEQFPFKLLILKRKEIFYLEKWFNDNLLNV